MLLDDSTPFAIKESFNMLRTNVMYSAYNSSECPVYAVTSVGESVGKSTVISNMALTFSQISKKTLLIDADMRCPVQYKIFGVDKNAAGLSEILSGIEQDDKKAIRKTSFPHLDLVVCGRVPPNPTELIMSDAFSYYLQKWTKEYDVIFIDFPPIGIVTDSVLICRNITGYLFVVRSNSSDSRKVNETIAEMDKIGAKVVGIILNAHNPKSTRRYGYEGRGYGRYGRYGKYGKYDKYARKNKYDTTVRENVKE